MPEKQISLNGRSFLLQTNMDITPAIVAQAMQSIINRMNPATCPDLIQNTTHNITVAVSPTALGRPPYTYRLFLDGAQIASQGPITGTSVTFPITANQAIGSHTLRGEIVDSCGTPQSAIDQCTFNIIPASSVLTSITISGCSTSLNVGGTCGLTATCRNQTNAVMTCPSLTWQSSNPSVATVNSSGTVTAISSGNANITASSGGVISNTATVSVSVSCTNLGIVINVA